MLLAILDPILNAEAIDRKDIRKLKGEEGIDLVYKNY